MGKLPLSVTASAVVHLVLVGWVVSRDVSIDREVEVEPPALTFVEIVAPTPAPGAADVSTTTNSATPPPPMVAATTTRRRGGAEPLTTTIPGEPTPPPTTPPTAIDKPRSPYLDMRSGGRADLTLPGTRDDLEHAPAGTAPAAGTPSSGQLAPNGAGRKTDAGSYVAKVDKDGHVKIEDRPDVSIGWAVPTPKEIGRGIAEWYESDKGPDGKRGKRTLEHAAGGSIDQPTAGCEGVRDNACSPDRSVTVIVPIVRGGFNPTDWLMRRTVGDPYASKKRAYLDATRDERAQIGATHRSEQLKKTSMIMRANLERAWASTTDVRERKQVLFELWDEIAEPADEESAVAEASRAARAQVIGFIRARLPQRDSAAYSASEIAALNARKQSSETFSPYE